MLIEKLYYTVPEVLERWGISEADLIYLAENDRLRLSVRVFHLPTEFCAVEITDDGDCVRIPHEEGRFTGLLDLHACDAFQLFRCGELRLSEFRTPADGYAFVRCDAAPVFVMIGDLLIRRDERDRFEAESFGGALCSSTLSPPRRTTRMSSATAIRSGLARSRLRWSAFCTPRRLPASLGAVARRSCPQPVREA